MSQTSPDDFIAPVCKDEIEIIFQDEHILLINKPTKLLSLSGKNPANLDSVHYRLMQDFPTALMIHRLDLGTSGIMLIALNKDIGRILNRQFSERLVNKTYTALLAGRVEHECGKIELPIAKGEFPYQTICFEKGKLALTEYQVLSYEDFHHSHHDQLQAQDHINTISRVIYKPHTGRTHQLRIHSQQLGHPILGCDLYAGQAGSGFENSEQMAERLMLHATRLEFNHPVSGERIIADCPCPF